MSFDFLKPFICEDPINMPDDVRTNVLDELNTMTAKFGTPLICADGRTIGEKSGRFFFCAVKGVGSYFISFCIFCENDLITFMGTTKEALDIKDKFVHFNISQILEQMEPILESLSADSFEPDPRNKFSTRLDFTALSLHKILPDSRPPKDIDSSYISDVQSILLEEAEYQLLVPVFTNYISFEERNLLAIFTFVTCLTEDDAGETVLDNGLIVLLYSDSAMRTFKGNVSEILGSSDTDLTFVVNSPKFLKILNDI